MTLSLWQQFKSQYENTDDLGTISVVVFHIYLFHVYVCLSAWVYVHLCMQEIEEARRGHMVPGSWIYMQLCLIVCAGN